MNFIYTLAFLKRNEQILMLNRVKQPWKGMWNGVGGKKNKDENSIDCIIREIKEETGITVFNHQVEDKGICTWDLNFSAEDSGLHLFIVHLNQDINIKTPLKTNEGILEWKDISWVNDKDNLGVCYNIPYFLENIFTNQKRFHYACTFEGNNLINVKVEEI